MQPTSSVGGGNVAVSSRQEEEYPIGSRQRMIFRNKAEFDSKLALLIAAGGSNLRVISDFDYTISRHLKDNGERASTCHGVLEGCNLLPPSYREAAIALLHHYYPLEIDPTLDLLTKTG